MQKLRAVLSMGAVGILGFVAGMLVMGEEKPPAVELSYDRESMSNSHALGRLPGFDPGETYYLSVSTLPELQTGRTFPKESPMIPAITAFSVGLGENGTVQGYQDVIERCDLVREKDYLCHVFRRPLPADTQITVFSASDSSHELIAVSDLHIMN